MNEDDPKIDTTVRYQAAIDLALVLSKTGEQERADLLLDRSLQYIQTLPRLGNRGLSGSLTCRSTHCRVRNRRRCRHSGKPSTRAGVLLWWYSLKYDPNLESLHDEPEYQGHGRRDRSRHGRLSLRGCARWSATGSWNRSPETRLCARDKPGTKVHDEEPFGSDGLGSPSSGSIPAFTFGCHLLCARPCTGKPRNQVIGCLRRNFCSLNEWCGRIIPPNLEAFWEMSNQQTLMRFSL